MNKDWYFEHVVYMSWCRTFIYCPSSSDASEELLFFSSSTGEGTSAEDRTDALCRDIYELWTMNIQEKLEEKNNSAAQKTNAHELGRYMQRRAVETLKSRIGKECSLQYARVSAWTCVSLRFVVFHCVFPTQYCLYVHLTMLFWVFTVFSPCRNCLWIHGLKTAVRVA